MRAAKARIWQFDGRIHFLNLGGRGTVGMLGKNVTETVDKCLWRVVFGWVFGIGRVGDENPLMAWVRSDSRRTYIWKSSD